MTSRLRVDISQAAAAQIEQAAAWWKDNRPAAPGAVYDELERALALLAMQPSLGARATNLRLRGVRRVHLPRVHYYLYYRATAEAIEVLAFWHTSRGSRPKT